MQILYESSDGRIFKTEEECELYEQKNIEIIDYWQIDHTADIEKTGLCKNRTYIKAIWKGANFIQIQNRLNILKDYCYSEFGNKTAWVKGTIPCSNWKIYTSNEKDFIHHSPILINGKQTGTEVMILEIKYGSEINLMDSYLYN